MSSDTFKFQIKGIAKLKAALIRIENSLGPSSDRALRRVCQDIAADAQRYCPVGTPASTGIPGYIGGSLRSTIRVLELGIDGFRITFYVTAGGFEVNPNTGKIVDYEVHVERGTSRRPATPYMRPAFDNHKASLVRLWKEELRY